MFVAGCSSAFHIGKVPVALPGLSTDLGLTLVSASWVVSLFSVLVALFGLLISLFASKLKFRNAAFIGLCIATVASFSGAYATSLAMLLLTRVFEGLGWMLAAVSIPSLLISVSHPKHRYIVLGLWGAFIPVGVAVSMLIAPGILLRADWRGLWFLASAATAIGALLIYFAGNGLRFGPGIQTGIVKPKKQHLTIESALAVVLQRAPLSAFGCFLVYSAQFLAVVSFLPILLLEKNSITIQDAAFLSALIVLANGMGNVLSGFLLSAGVSRFHLLRCALISMMVFSVCVFIDQISLPLRIASAFGFTALAGLIPGTLFATAPLLVRDITHVSIINGLILQAAGLGQFLGPIVVANLVEFSRSWTATLVFIAAACIFGLFCVRVMQISGVEK